MDKPENIIIKELIEKYSSLENEYYEMKIKLSNENNSLKQQIQKLNINNNINSPKNNKIEEEKDDQNHITIDTENAFSSVWCMLKLNPIIFVENENNTILN